ncbi:type VI secretion system tip protein VgrG, partial [Yersinia rochesterensis]|nr:type VI secretion system tip protein VgrG [Yersinia rochesterensis]
EYGTASQYLRKVKRTAATAVNTKQLEFPFMPGATDSYKRSFILLDDRTLQPIDGIRYVLKSSLGTITKGVTGDSGLTGFLSHTEESEVDLTILEQNSLVIG